MLTRSVPAIAIVEDENIYKEECKFEKCMSVMISVMYLC
jgi:hypothetical protein